jgi:hypothetical protein
MSPIRLRRLRGLSLTVAIVAFGISWSLSLAHLRSGLQPLLWALALPALALYYCAGPRRQGALRYVPAGALAIYAVVLWQATRGYGAAGTLWTVTGVAVGVVAMWYGGYLSARATAAAQPAPRLATSVAPRPLGSGVARRRRLRSAGVR